jgi:hypothetical protein
MAKKKKAAPTPNMFDYLDSLQGEVKKEPATDVEALRAQIAEQGRLLAEMQSQGQRQYPMVQTTAPAVATTHHVDPAKLTVSTEGLPDRDADPDAYWREYNTRVNASMLAQTKAVRDQLTAQFEQERNAERLWNGFKETYPAWGKYTSLVETVSNRVFTDLENKGVDVRRLIQGQPEKFYSEVDSALRQQYGKLVDDVPAGGGSEEDEEEEFLDPSDPALVAGVGGAGSGAPSQGAGQRSKPSAEPDMLSDLKAIQQRMGIA